jgi:hypothetical protein
MVETGEGPAVLMIFSDGLRPARTPQFPASS